MKVKNMESHNGNTIANQFIIESDNLTVFQSYNSKIAEWDGETLTIFKDWDYSKTTLKYFKMFVEDYTNIKYETKQKFLKFASESERVKFD